MRVTEIFFSLQGEGSRAGLPCVFVRFTGCDLRCVYCDTAYAFHGGREMTAEEILAEVARFGCKLVLLTGGEPLLQRELPALARALLSRGHEVTVETHGQRPLEALPAEVVRIVDVKTPDSGEVAKDLAYLDRLSPRDEVKFVVGSRADFLWSQEVIRRHALQGRVQILFSPVWGAVEPRELAEWLLASGLDARLSLQIHKVIWGPEARGV
ncbi:MAG TPA: radical SAM protein [Anaeromyxobacter sp.]|nr:radical SAM protein [Anaeromyxobacter sp.]